MEEPGGDGGHVHLEVDEEAGHLQGVGEIGLAGGPLLALMGALGEPVGALEQIQVSGRLVLGDLLDERLQLGQPYPSPG
jgi:hypothetical protein